MDRVLQPQVKDADSFKLADSVLTLICAPPLRATTTQPQNSLSVSVRELSEKCRQKGTDITMTTSLPDCYEMGFP